MSAGTYAGVPVETLRALPWILMRSIVRLSFGEPIGEKAMQALVEEGLAVRATGLRSLHRTRMHGHLTTKGQVLRDALARWAFAGDGVDDHLPRAEHLSSRKMRARVLRELGT